MSDIIRPVFGNQPVTPAEEPADTRNVVWTCLRCSCTTFFIRPDYVIECAECGQNINQTGDTVGWKHRPPDVPAVTEEIVSERTVVEFMDSGAHMKRMRDHLDAKTTAFVIHVSNAGDVHTLGSMESKDQVEWFERRIATAREMLLPQAAAEPEVETP